MSGIAFHQCHWITTAAPLVANSTAGGHHLLHTINGTRIYLTDFIKNYHPSRTLRSADKLLLSVPRMTLALSAKAFNVSAPSVWTHCQSGQLSLSVVSGVLWKLNCLTLRTANINTLPSPAQHAPLIRLRHLLYKCILIVWLNDSLWCYANKMRL